MRIQKNEHIILTDDLGTIIGMWKTVAQAAADLNVGKQTIMNHLEGRIKRSLKIEGKLSLMTIEEQPEPTAEELFVDLEGEIWKPVKGFEDYEISNYGRMRRDFKLRKFETKDPKRYIHTSLVRNGKNYNVYIHRLVAENFLEDWDPALVVNHKDENKHNNHVSNLEMLTLAENFEYSRNLHKDEWTKKAMETKGGKMIAKRGVRCIELDLVYETLTEAAEAVGVNYSSSISRCCRGELQTAHGFHWEWVE